MSGCHVPLQADDMLPIERVMIEHAAQIENLYNAIDKLWNRIEILETRMRELEEWNRAGEDRIYSRIEALEDQLKEKK